VIVTVDVSPSANFLGAAICGALGTLWFWWFVYRKKNDLTRRRKRSAAF
jgi:hypothetical protein